MDTISALIEALTAFEGGVVIVSHDAHLISAVCNELWVCQDKGVRVFDGDFEDYRKSLTKNLKSNAKLPSMPAHILQPATKK